MKIDRSVFNIYLCALSLVWSGCSSSKDPDKNVKTAIRLHIEARNRDDRTAAVPIYRKSPLRMFVQKEPILNESHISSAKVVEDLEGGGFSIELHFIRHAAWIIERASVDNKGHHLAIYAEFGQARWLAAPLMVKPISAGTLVFTPDATRKEAERIVKGLNNVASKLTTYEKW